MTLIYPSSEKIADKIRRLRGPSREEDELYAFLTSGIATKQIRPGARLKELALAAQFGISRARVRRVLQQLAELSVVEFKLNLGAIVSRPTPAEARDVFRVRRVLEAEAVRATIRSARPDVIQRLRAFTLHEQLAFAAERSGLVGISSGFHSVLAEICGNPVLGRVLNQLIHRCVLIQALYERDNQGTICLTHDHVHIVDAIEQGRLDVALNAMELHFDSIERSMAFELHGE